jgi:hypothetical protein
VIAIGVAVGLVVALGPRAFDDASASRERASLPSGAVPLASLSTRQVADATAAAGAAVASASVEPEAPDAPAPSPTDAVTAFLAAEVAGRFDVSYGLLSADDRAQVGGRIPWAESHANLPPLTGFAVDSVVVAGDEATVAARTDLRSSLDEVVGLVPAHAQASWIAVREDGGWRVAYSRSRLVPQYPSDALASDAAREWVTARQACHQAAEWPGGLVGSDAVARRLCRAAGAVALGAPTRLPDDTSASALAAAFGPDVYAWARLVPVTEPARLELIVAPVGERWLVIGARAASTSAS